MKHISGLFLFLTGLLFACFPHLAFCADSARADGASALPSQSGIWKEIGDGFDWRLKTLAYGVIQDPIDDSPLNYHNAFNLNSYQAEWDIRPDLHLKFRDLELGVSPRFNLTWEKWEEGEKKGDTDIDFDAYVNYWLVRYMLSEKLFASYGRENLQWGPSYLLSVSNPFNRANGRNNPKIEVPGLDFARAVWIPSYEWTVSFIANTEEGAADFVGRFDRAYALKVDYTGSEKYLGLIPYYRESDDHPGVGFFGRWSATDALLLYGEANAPHGDSLDVLVGSSYTLAMGPTLSFEYYYNAGGCTGPIQECFAESDISDRATFSIDNFASEEPYIRKNYIMLQFVDTRIWDKVNIVTRWIADLDDGSSRSIGILEYDVGNHVQLFAIGNYFAGSDESEFGSLLQYSAFGGVELNF